MIFGNDASCHKDLRRNPSKKGEFDAEQVSSWGIPSLVRVVNQAVPMLNPGDGQGPLRLVLGPSEGPSS